MIFVYSRTRKIVDLIHIVKLSTIYNYFIPNYRKIDSRANIFIDMTLYAIQVKLIQQINKKDCKEKKI